MQVPNTQPGNRKNLSRVGLWWSWPAAETLCSPEKAVRRGTNYETWNATAEHLNTSYACKP